MQPPGGFDFLGYHFDAGGRRGRATKSLKKLQDSGAAEDPRTSGAASAVIVATSTARSGWFEYFKHSHGSFTALDRWIRMRCAAFCANAGRPRSGREPDHHRWPNAFFTAHGLFSLAQAHAAHVSPLAR